MMKARLILLKLLYIWIKYKLFCCCFRMLAFSKVFVIMFPFLKWFFFSQIIGYLFLVEGNFCNKVSSFLTVVFLWVSFIQTFNEIFYLFRDDQIMKRNGPDAIQYLSFQRHIIIFLAIICVICLTVVLPVNYQGDLGESFK